MGIEHRGWNFRLERSLGEKVTAEHDDSLLKWVGKWDPVTLTLLRAYTLGNKQGQEDMETEFIIQIWLQIMNGLIISLLKRDKEGFLLQEGNSVFRNAMPLGLGEGAWRKRSNKRERRWQETIRKQAMKKRIKGWDIQR